MGIALHGYATRGEITGDHRYTDYVSKRFEFLGKAAAYFRSYKKAFPSEVNPLEHFLYPQLLDDTGSMCAAMIQGLRMGMVNDLRPEIDNSINFIMNKVHRLGDGTFARNRPMPNSVWVDDLYQGIPALAHMGKLTGDRKYYDEATTASTAVFRAVVQQGQTGLYTRMGRRYGTSPGIFLGTCQRLGCAGGCLFAGCTS